MSSNKKEYGYIAYIDEAGDPGLKRVRPVDPDGASEWLVLSAVVMKAMREPAVIGWVQNIIRDLGIKQRYDLHYRTLSQKRKITAGNMIATLPIRAFVLCSNKNNMRGYNNPRAAQMPSQQWFYNWCVRLLLERVTAFCAACTGADYGEQKTIKIEFSERGGHHYSQTAAYHYYLRHQQQGGQVYLTKREPVTSMLDWDLMDTYPHGERAGLQLADFAASSFYQAIDCNGPGKWDIEPAKALSTVIPKEAGLYRDFGVALFPTPAWKADLTPDQKRIFEFYGYDFARW